MSISSLISQHPLAFHIAIITACFIVLVKAADMVVFGIDRYAKKEGLSDYLIGLLVVSLTASTPELVSSINGLRLGDTGIIFGTILGSNIAGITLVLGIYALVGRRIKLKNKILTKMEVILFFLMSVPFLLATDGVLSRLDGAVLIGIYLIYVIVLWKKEAAIGRMKKDVKLKVIWEDALIFIMAIVALFLSSQFLVDSSIKASKIIGLPSFVMAVVVLGIASSLPDLFVGIRSILKGDSGIGIGNSLGSIIVKVLLFFGIFALIKPLAVDFSYLTITILATIFSLAFVLYLSEKGKMNWKHGLILLFIYIAYISIELVTGLMGR